MFLAFVTLISFFIFNVISVNKEQQQQNQILVLWFGWFIFGFSTQTRKQNTHSHLLGLLFGCLSYGIPFGVFFSSSYFFLFRFFFCSRFGCCCSSSSRSTCIMRETRAHNSLRAATRIAQKERSDGM